MRIFSIILADDEQQILYGMKKGIEWEKLGFRVAGVAQNGKEALELMEEVHPDLVISDIKMPFMDGLELAKHIHEDYMNTKVILFSGWDDFEYARLAISYGVSEYIMKPINYEEMQNLLMKMHEELDKEYNEKMNRARLEHAYMESLPLLRQQFFTRLVTEKMNKNELQSQIDNLKLEFTDAVYSVVAMKVGRGDEKDVLSELAVKQTIKEALEKITRVYEFGMSDNEIFILGSNKKHDVGRITRTIDEAVVLIERIFQSRISCGISVSREKIEDMPSLYEQALEALDYNLVTVEESYTYYNDIMPVQDVKEDWNTKVENIGKNITHYTEEELKSQVESLLAWLHRRQYSLNEYQVLILEISFSFSRFYKKYQITSDMEFAGTKKMAVKILSLSTGEELDHWLVNYCELIRSLIQKKQIDNNVILAEHARKIVEERFPDPDLSVETVCGKLHVSSSYFSKIFKQETGGTFVNYLTGRRMEEAKKLLLQTDYKSQVIGNMVGYPEPNYFSYVFKKNCGMSPVKYRKQGGGVIRVLAWGGFSAAVVYLITDNLSTAIIVMGITCITIFVVHPKTKIFVGIAGVGIVLAIAGARILGTMMETSGSFRLRRILVWLNPEKYASEGGYQIMQALYAIGSGGFFGKGLGNSAQKMIIPEVQNDMILSIICEELGVFGAIMVLILFGMLLYRLLFIAQNAPDLYGSLIVTGIFAHIALQVILNVMVVINCIPTTGITLPFISYGGTSVLFLMAEMGLALGVSARIKIAE